MARVVIIALILACFAFGEEEAPRGVHRKKSEFSAIDDIRVDIVSPDAVLSTSGDNANTVVKVRDQSPNFNPLNLTVGGETKKDSATAPPEAPKTKADIDKMPGFSLRVGEIDQLIKYDFGSDGLAKKAYLSDGTSVNNPTTNGMPINSQLAATIATKGSNFGIDQIKGSGPPQTQCAG